MPAAEASGTGPPLRFSRHSPTLSTREDTHPLQGPLDIRRDRIAWLDSAHRAPWERRGELSASREWTETRPRWPGLDFLSRHLRLLPFEINAAAASTRASQLRSAQCPHAAAARKLALTVGGSVMTAVYDGASQAHYHAHYDERAGSDNGGRRVTAVSYLEGGGGEGGMLRSVIRTSGEFPLLWATGVHGAAAAAPAAGEDVARWRESGRCPGAARCCHRAFGPHCDELPRRTRDRRVGMLVALQRHRTKRAAEQATGSAGTPPPAPALMCEADSGEEAACAELLGEGRCRREEALLACDCDCLCTVSPRPGRLLLFLSQHVPHEVTAMGAGGRRAAATLWMTQRAESADDSVGGG